MYRIKKQVKQKVQQQHIYINQIIFPIYLQCHYRVSHQSHFVRITQHYKIHKCNKIQSSSCSGIEFLQNISTNKDKARLIPDKKGGFKSQFHEKKAKICRETLIRYFSGTPPGWCWNQVPFFSAACTWPYELIFQRHFSSGQCLSS